MSSRSSEENVAGPSSADDDTTESKFYTTFDAVVSQFERFHVDSQQTKKTFDVSAAKGGNCSELDNTVESLTVSISAMNVASTPTKKETLENRTVSANDKDNLHKRHYNERLKRRSRRGQCRKHQSSSRSLRYFNSKTNSYRNDHPNAVAQYLDGLQIMWLNGLYHHFKLMNFINGTASF